MTFKRLSYLIRVKNITLSFLIMGLFGSFIWYPIASEVMLKLDEHFGTILLFNAIWLFVSVVFNWYFLSPHIDASDLYNDKTWANKILGTTIILSRFPFLGMFFGLSFFLVRVISLQWRNQEDEIDDIVRNDSEEDTN